MFITVKCINSFHFKIMSGLLVHAYVCKKEMLICCVIK